MSSQVVKVKREVIEACMTCPLCKKILREATTISLCLHTFCRKCIYEKLSDDDVDTCPVCNIDLGCLPVEKLRPDHNLQDIRAKIFPLKRRKVQAPEVSMPSISPPAKRKERSLSSLVINTPKVPVQIGSTGKRSKGSGRKASALRGSSIAVESKKGEDSVEEYPMSSSSPDSSSKITQNKRQDSSKAETSHDQRFNEDLDNDNGIKEGKADLWTPLNCLVEAANRTKSSKSYSQGSALPDSEPYMPDGNKPKAMLPNASDSEIYLAKPKLKEHGQSSKFNDEKTGTSLLPGQVKRRRIRASIKKREAGSDDLMVDSHGAKLKRTNCPIWFTLVASEDQKGDASLPQISTAYLRIKDGKMPVSYIQKYLVKKLDLTSESEVIIMCQGQPVLPNLQLHNLVDLWFRTSSTSKKLPVSVGSSAKDFVMVLSYCRKVEAS